ncbi:MAG: hypothetical protein JNL60_18185 [Bacteroidia bacterium]|nr:hypothetical protein [Bacteroidia bacterium]
MNLKICMPLLLSLVLCLNTSCDKGYQVRFTNYYIEPMDSVIIGNHYIVYDNVDLQATTEYKKLMAGKHSVLMITKSQKKISADLIIPSKGSGKRTFQIDAIEQTVLLED